MNAIIHLFAGDAIAFAEPPDPASASPRSAGTEASQAD
jgi:hypothetical protein